MNQPSPEAAVQLPKLTRATRVLMLDNYDSFTYNVVQCIASLGADVHTVRNDCITVEEALAHNPTHVVISPGPGKPSDAGVSANLIRAFADRSTPVFGICLGHQAIVEVFGGVVGRAGRLMHGKSSVITHDGCGVYAGLPDQMEVGRYHSLTAEIAHLPAELVATSHTLEGELMGVRHRTLPIEGVQFHPESVLTPEGPSMLRTFLDTQFAEQS